MATEATPDHVIGTVTVFFSDIRGFTDYTSKHGNDAAFSLLQTHNSLLEAEITAHQGTIIKTEGDCFMVSFSSGRTAIFCALAVQKRLREHNATSAEPPIHVGIGINTGEAVLKDGDLFGSAVNLASRLCGVATAGQVLISDTVRQIVGPLTGLRFVERGEIQVKGFPDPQRVCEVEPLQTATQLSIVQSSSPKVLLWNDASDAISSKLSKRLVSASANSSHRYDVALLSQPTEIFGYELTPASPSAIVLIVSDVTKLSDTEATRTMLNARLEAYVRSGGGLIGTHDIIYRRTRNAKLEEMFGCTINEFRRVDEPLTYCKTDECAEVAFFNTLPDRFELDDNEICWGTWAPDCNVLFRSQDGKPLVVLREYGNGTCIWTNSGDYRDFPPRSILMPQQALVDLLQASIAYILQAGS